MRVLVVNAGSSSLKVRLLDDDELVSSYDALPDPPPEVDAVGHRVVHGGTRFVEPVKLDEEIEAALRDLTDLAPLHQPKSLRGIDAARALLPTVPHVACFDTAFHARLPPAAATVPLPAEWRERFGLRKYGFHGLSHAWAARRAVELSPGARRVVTCHLGAGASLAAVLDGVSVDTTMGFTPLDGLVMATRPGRLDPGMVLWLEEHAGLTGSELADVLEHGSGLTALAGTGDMRVLLGRDDAGARLAVDVYVHRLCAEIAGMTAALGGLDALVFTGGVGENSPEVRLRAATGLGFLGVAVDPLRNTEAGGVDLDISAETADVATLVVASREDLEIARSVRRLIGRT